MAFGGFTYQNKILVLHFHGKMLWNKPVFMLKKIPKFSLHQAALVVIFPLFLIDMAAVCGESVDNACHAHCNGNQYHQHAAVLSTARKL